MYIPAFTRTELYEMTTKELYKLDGELISLKKRVEAELIARGDF